MRLLTIFAFILALIGAASGRPLRSGTSLKYEVFGSDSTSFCVTSTFIYGEHEGMLVDVGFRLSDAQKVADRISSSGKQLKEIFITHPHDDHYLCTGFWKQRFPNTPIYMSSTGLKEFNRSAMKYFTYLKNAYPKEVPDTLVTPEVLPSPHLTLDGEQVEVFADQQGDEWIRSNSYLWIPSTRTIIAGDMVFDGVHVWLANSNRQSRDAWITALDRMDALQPSRVVAGHKWDAAAPDSRNVIAATRSYIKRFDEIMHIAGGSDDLTERMASAFPNLRLKNILMRAARVAIPD